MYGNSMQEEQASTALQLASRHSPQRAYTESLNQLSVVDPQVAAAWTLQSGKLANNM